MEEETYIFAVGIAMPERLTETIQYSVATARMPAWLWREQEAQ